MNYNECLINYINKCPYDEPIFIEEIKDYFKKIIIDNFETTFKNIYVYNYDLGAPLGYVYHLSTSFKGPKVTSIKKNTTTAKKTVKMVTGVSLKVKKKKINIRFKLISNVSKYQIMYSTKKSFKGSKVVTVKTGNSTLKKLKSRKTYFVKVRAIGKNGKAGAWSTVKKARVK